MARLEYVAYAAMQQVELPDGELQAESTLKAFPI